ncbi:hypothetical protein D3C75_999070 [compost metagenome]
MNFLEHAGRPDAIAIGDYDIKRAARGILQIVQRLPLPEECIHLEPELAQQPFQHTKIALPEHILHRYNTPQINGRRVLDRTRFHIILEQGLQDNVVAIVGVALEADRFRRNNRQFPVLELVRDSTHIVTDHLNHAAGYDNVQVTVHDL